MNILMLVLRLVHIVAAIFWGGGALVMELIIKPGIDATGEAGGLFARHLNNTTRISLVMMVAAILTILPGVLLYWIDSAGFSSAWMRSGAGIGFGIGGVFGVVALVCGAIFGRSNARLGQISAQITGMPGAEQAAQIRAIQKRLRVVSPLHVVAMILAMAFMATARYFTF